MNDTRSQPLAGVRAMLLAICTAALPVPASAVDPFGTDRLAPANQGAPWNGGDDACPRLAATTGALTLAGVIERALCHHPQTRQSWTAARNQAAQVGRNRAAYLPEVTIDGQAGASRTWPRNGGAVSQESTSASATVSYLLFDFGARDANFDTARQLLEAANWSHNATLQSVFLAAIQSYYQLFATGANVEAALQAEKASEESMKAAETRYRVGTGTPADRLQAKTAFSQARLTRTRAEGERRVAAGVLANAIGLDADAEVDLASPRIQAPDPATDARVRELVDYARMLRPDLAAAEAKVQAARAQVRVALAAGKPTVSLTGSAGLSDSNSASLASSGAVGISVSFPLFTGYRNTYDIRSAQIQVEAREADRDQLRNQVSLDVWRAYQSLATERTALVNAEDLLQSALESENVARGRYKAGAGTFIDLLNAQSAAASARFQSVQARYNWHLAKAALASALGTLDLAALPGNADTVVIDTTRSTARK
ncbi:MAG: TolC family protein [Burkholderiales bacterium]